MSSITPISHLRQISEMIWLAATCMICSTILILSHLKHRIIWKSYIRHPCLDIARLIVPWSCNAIIPFAADASGCPGPLSYLLFVYWQGGIKVIIPFWMLTCYMIGWTLPRCLNLAYTSRPCGCVWSMWGTYYDTSGDNLCLSGWPRVIMQWLPDNRYPPKDYNKKWTSIWFSNFRSL